MALLSIAHLRYAIGDRLLLDGASLTLDHGQHVGLVGRNGCGKSTLLKLIAGLGGITPDSGQIQLARGAIAGYLTQDPQLDPDKTLRQEAETALAHLHSLHEQLHDISHQMTTATGEALDNLLKQYEKVEEQIEVAGGYAMDHQVDATLHGLGLDDRFFDVPVSGLSGGQKGRLSLAKLLLSSPDLLLLDEPTNHLDIAGREWLEQYLASYNGAVILVSHDRWLLDRVVTTIYELEGGRLVDYPGNYQKYRELRAERRLAQAREHEKQQEHIRREQAFIDRYRAGQRARQAQGREKRLERFLDSQTTSRPMELDAMDLRLQPRSRPGDLVVVADDLTKAYPDKPLFRELSVVIKRGDRVGIIGPNGAGKSTLVNCLLGELPADRGVVKVGPSVDVGYYRQTHEGMDQSLTVVEYLQKFLPAGSNQAARDLAGAFLFTGNEQDKPLRTLSGGERSRAALAGLVCGGHNLLVLDEPTNHLDIPSAERLEDALERFSEVPSGFGQNTSGGGTLILITHDRMLLEKLANQLVIFDGGGHVRLFPGKYSEYLAVLAQQQQQQKAAAENRAAVSKPASAKQQPASAPKQNKPQQSRSGGAPAKKGNSALTRLSQPDLERKIVEVETELAKIDQRLADPGLYRDGGKVKQLQDQRQQLRDKLTPLEEEWARRAESD